VPTSLVPDADGIVAPPCGNAVTAASSRLALGARSFAIWSLSFGALYLVAKSEDGRRRPKFDRVAKGHFSRKDAKNAK
jgi:hypothetical protein